MYIYIYIRQKICLTRKPASRRRGSMGPRSCGTGGGPLRAVSHFQTYLVTLFYYFLYLVRRDKGSKFPPKTGRGFTCSRGVKQELHTHSLTHLLVYVNPHPTTSIYLSKGTPKESDKFANPRRFILAPDAVGVKAQLKQLRETGRYDCFDLKWQPVYEEHRWKWPSPAPVFWDSDVAKWLEGACYLLADAYDPEVDAAVREIALMIRAAQREDGYLNVYFTVVKPGERWTDIRDQHEL